MAKTAVINVRTDPQTKVAADTLFSNLGLSTSNAINILLKQAIRNRGIFISELPTYEGALDVMKLSRDELIGEISRNHNDALKGAGRPAKDVFDDLDKRIYG